MTHADSIWAKALELHSDSLQSEVDSLQAKLDALQAKSDLIYSVVEPANSGVANQLSTITFWLEFIAIVIAVGGGLLGFYISKKRREIERMARTVDEKKVLVEELAGTVDVKKQEVEALAKTTEDLDKKIHSDITGLYNDLRKEETKTIFQRLVKEPLDIDNLSSLLLAREVDSDNYPLLKQAYLNLPEKIEHSPLKDGYLVVQSDSKHNYMLQFFQHFFYQSVKDDDIRPIFVEYFKNIFDNAFDSDLIRATEGLCKALTDADSKFDKADVLFEFLKAINISKFRNFATLRKLLEENLNIDGLLQSVIERCTENKIYLSLFGITSPEKGQDGQDKNSE